MKKRARAITRKLRQGSRSLEQKRAALEWASKTPSKRTSVLVMGVGAFAHSTAQILKENGADVAIYLTRDYAQFSPSLAGPTYRREEFPSPCSIVRQNGVDLIVPMSIDWAQATWAEGLLAQKASIFSPVGEGIRIERERDFARKLCNEFGIPFPQAHLAQNRLEAEKVLQNHPRAFVIKNPLCSPTSPVHTILCQSLEDTRSWLKHVNDAEGIFLQE